MRNIKNNRPTAAQKLVKVRRLAPEPAQSEVSSLAETFLNDLADMYNAEQQLTKALPEMAKEAQSSELGEALESHLKEIEGQITRLEKVAANWGKPWRARKGKAMEGLIKEEKMFERTR